MKLKTFNPDSCPQAHNQAPGISINFKTGLISINKAACVLIKLGGG